MPSTEVQRTLVKSPPELWAELSDAAALARHLGALGEIRVTRVEPESAVEWEAEQVTGSIQLKPSGWGTRVTFSVTRESPEPAQEPATEEPATEEPATEEPVAEDPVVEGAVEEGIDAVMVDEAPAEPPVVAEPLEAEPAAVEACEEPKRRGFFARLFRRRRTAPVGEPIAAVAVAESAPAVAIEPAPEAAAEEPAPEETERATEQIAEEAHEAPDDVATPDLAAELAKIEQEMVDRDTAILTAVLDRLGAAHHRPFSRG